VKQVSIGADSYVRGGQHYVREEVNPDQVARMAAGGGRSGRAPPCTVGSTL